MMEGTAGTQHNGVSVYYPRQGSTKVFTGSHPHASSGHRRYSELAVRCNKESRSTAEGATSEVQAVNAYGPAQWYFHTSGRQKPSLGLCKSSCPSLSLPAMSSRRDLSNNGREGRTPTEFSTLRVNTVATSKKIHTFVAFVMRGVVPFCLALPILSNPAWDSIGAALEEAGAVTLSATAVNHRYWHVVAHSCSARDDRCT
ncbi:hypothetical protein OH77DRAFT_138138 [Trametes cingulata]|nr:hypothetical protein OH77DRAFT_138138 [Trametes cingulata]